MFFYTSCCELLSSRSQGCESRGDTCNSSTKNLPELLGYERRITSLRNGRGAGCPEYASRTQFEVDEKGFVCVVECVEIETLLNTERFNENFSCRNRRSDPSFVFPLFLRAMRVPGGSRTASHSWAPLSKLPDPRTTSRSGSLASLERRIIFRAFASLRVANFGRV